MPHIPVLLNEVIQYLNPQPNENFIDCTCGFAGHSQAILEKTAPEGKVLGIERDTDVFERVKQQNIERLILVNDSYGRLKEIIEEHNFGPVEGILFDLGMSSWQIDESGRGFTFQKDEPLDMRYSSGNRLTAAEILNSWPEAEIGKVLKEYGGERFARHIAKVIVQERRKERILTTARLVEIIFKATPGWYHHRKINPATQTFQALRIAVNDELDNLQKALPQALDCLKSGGWMVVISFHALEDGICKRFFKEAKESNIVKILTKKPGQPSPAEITVNPRARSARLRAAVKL